MKLDRNAVNMLLSMDDEQLKAVIRSLAVRAGVDLSALNISENDIAGVRRALAMATDEDIARAAEQLEARGENAKEEGLLTRVSARIGMAFQTMLDSTTSHIAEMMVEGSNMGITDMIKLLNTYAPEGRAQEAVRLAQEVVSFEEHNLEMLKRYL